MNKEKSLIGLVLFLVFTAPTRSQKAGDITKDEQSIFGTEEVPGIPFVKRPLPVPDAALPILSEDADVKGCLSDNPLPPGHSLASWFIGSEIHLDGPSENDLVVVPLPDNGCFHSAAGIGTFWILRRVGEQYELVLKALGNGLTILGTKHNGYRSIQTGTIGQAGRQFTTVIFRFDGKCYQKYREETQEKGKKP
jgi:hypothetical protein